MKQNIVRKVVITFLGLSAVWLFEGCGSNSKVDGGIGRTGESGLSITPEIRAQGTSECVEKFIIHGVDGNGNPIPDLSVKSNIVVNVKAQGSGVIKTESPIRFEDPVMNFNIRGVGLGDKLMIIPTANRHDPSYLGDWKVHAASGGSLTLENAAYNLETTDSLFYVVGNEKKFVESIYATETKTVKDGNKTKTITRNTAIPAHAYGVAHIRNNEQNVTSVDDGFAYITVDYDVELSGQQFVLGVHMDGYRVGTAYVGCFPACGSLADRNLTFSNCQ